MKHRICIFLGCLMLLLTGSPHTLYASQAYGHLYFAEMMLQSSSGQYLSLNGAARNSFLMGSLAPDSAWIAHMITNPSIRERFSRKYEVKFPKTLSPLPVQIDDVHQVRPTAVSLQLIVAAETAETRASALGWLSHYTVDSYIHNLINKQGGLVTDPTQFEDPAMMLHDRLEALEMRHVLQLRGQSLRADALDASSAALPVSFLRTALASAYPQNVFYVNHPKYFTRAFHFASDLIIDSTRWYGYQSKHPPYEILRMKKLLHRLRPNAGKLIDVLTDLPSLEEYNKNLKNGKFITEWTIEAEEIRHSSSYFMENCAAYYWFKDRQTVSGLELAAMALSRIEGEMRRINPADDLMQPRKIR